MVHALVASYLLKKLVVEEYGPGATSLGGTGVERGWWHNEIQESARTAVWSTNAGRQYRAVVAWKRELRSALSYLVQYLGTKGSSAGRCAQSLLSICEDASLCLNGEMRPCLNAASEDFDEPSDERLNIGFDLFRRDLVGNAPAGLFCYQL